jgi:hypothetical protein
LGSGARQRCGNGRKFWSLKRHIEGGAPRGCRPARARLVRGGAPSSQDGGPRHTATRSGSREWQRRCRHCRKGCRGRGCRGGGRRRCPRSRKWDRGCRHRRQRCSRRRDSDGGSGAGRDGSRHRHAGCLHRCRRRRGARTRRTRRRRIICGSRAGATRGRPSPRAPGNRPDWRNRMPAWRNRMSARLVASRSCSVEVTSGLFGQCGTAGRDRPHAVERAG